MRGPVPQAADKSSGFSAASASPQQLPDLDAATLGSWRSMLPAPQLGEIYQAFVTQTSARLSTLRLAAQAGDGTALSAAAHAIAGSAGMIGATRLEAACRACRARIREGAELDELVEPMEDAFRSLRARLQQEGLAL